MTGLKVSIACASGPPCTTTTTGGGSAPAAGGRANIGIRSPSKLRVSMHLGARQALGLERGRARRSGAGSLPQRRRTRTRHRPAAAWSGCSRAASRRPRGSAARSRARRPRPARAAPGPARRLPWIRTALAPPRFSITATVRPSALVITSASNRSSAVGQHRRCPRSRARSGRPSAKSAPTFEET